MQILTKKRFQFGSGTEKFITKGHLIIETAPDWIEKDPLFALAVSDGDLTVIQVQQPVKAAKRAAKAEE